MVQETVRSMRNFGRCIQFEARLQKPGLEPIICTEPMDLVHIDYVKMEVTVGLKEKPEVKDVLVVEDHFTCYLQAYVTKNHTARTTARVLYNEYFSVFGFPHRLMSDQAPEFSGKVIAALCNLLGVAKIHTSPYHPQSNGAVERAHQTMTNDREIRPRETMQMEVALGLCIDCIQCYQIIDNGVLALLLNVWAQTPPTY